MGNWEKFNETLLHKKEDFYSQLTMEDITDEFVKILKSRI